MIDKYDGSTRTLYFSSPINISTNGKQPSIGILEFVNSIWSKRAQPTTLGQGTDKGIAFEYMIQLANTLDANPWINIPTAANDVFVEKLATLIKNKLKPGLKCYIDHSNETWNFGFPGYHYSEAKARQLGLTGTIIPADAWHAFRAIEIFKIFNRVFDEPDLKEARKHSRLVRVLTSQTAWLDRTKAVMDWQMPDKQWPTNGLPAYRYADAWGITAYFGNDIQQGLENASLDELINLQIQLIETLFGDEKNPGLIRQLLLESNSRNLKLVAYEGGTHLLAPNNDPDLVSKLALVNQDKRMKEVYLLWLKKWNQLYDEYGKDNIGVINHYHDVSQYSKYGYWGLLQSTYQDIETAPKYQAIIESLK